MPTSCIAVSVFAMPHKAKVQSYITSMCSRSALGIPEIATECSYLPIVNIPQAIIFGTVAE
jgi:hypothetical protein